MYTSTRSDDFKVKSLIVIKRLVNDLEDELKEKDIIQNIESRVIKIDDKITGLKATINNRKCFTKKGKRC